MPTDTASWIWCIVVPTMVSAIACLFGWRYRRGTDGDVATVRATVASTVVALAWCVAVALSLQASDSFRMLLDFQEDAWPQVIWPMLAVAIFISPHSLTPRRNESGLWVLVGISGVVAASVVMPTGDGWADMLSLHQPWIAAVSIAAICNTWALHRMLSRGAERWLPLVILAGIACAAIIGAAAYGALLQTCVGAICATSVIAIFAGLGWLPSSAAIIFPSVLFIVTMVASGRFFSYADVPAGAYGLSLFAPSMIALSDRLVTHHRDIIRIAMAAVTAILIVGLIAYRFLIS